MRSRIRSGYSSCTVTALNSEWTSAINLIDRPLLTREASPAQSCSPRPATKGRVLVVAPQPFYEDRGTPIAVRNVVEALSQVGYGVDLLTYPVGQPVSIPGVEVFRSANPLRLRSVPVGFSIRKLVLDATLVLALVRRLRSHRYVCIHAVEEAAFPAVMLARRSGTPVIYDMQSSLPEQMTAHAPFRSRAMRRLLGSCERWLLRNVDAVMSSTGLAHRVRLLAPDVRVREWAFPVREGAEVANDAAEIRKQLGISDSARMVVYTGTFEAYQGLPDLVAGIPHVLADVPNAVFVLIGADPAGIAVIRKQTAALGLNDAVRLVERQPRERMQAFLCAADVLVSPRSYGNNLPLKIFDYLAAGKPIVATDIPPHRTILNEERAVLVKPDAESIASGVAAVLREPLRAAQLGAAAREYAARHLGWITFVQSVSEFYEKVRLGDERS